MGRELIIRMERNMGRSSTVILLLVLAILGSWEMKLASGELSADQCHLERNLLVSACKPLLYGRGPTPLCCERIRAGHVECICTVITPKLAALVDINRAIRIVEGCGRRVPRNFKCGSITTPP